MSSTTTKLSEDFWLGMFTPALLAVWIIPATLFRAWVITELWYWYIVAGFGVQPLRMSIAFGLSVIIALMMPNGSSKDDRSFGVVVAGSFVSPAMSLLLGWVGHFFV